MEITARLENWTLDRDHYILWGNINEDIKDRWCDGTYIHTSGIMNCVSSTENEILPDDLHEGCLVYTYNSIYLLGKKLEVHKQN